MLSARQSHGGLRGKAVLAAHGGICLGAQGSRQACITASFADQVPLSEGNGNGAEMILVVSWEDLRAGKVPELS